MYPGTNIRTRVGTDGVVSLTVPARLATDAEAARIAQTVNGLLGQTFVLSVRAHRRSRYAVNGANQGSQATANAILTLRPPDTAAARIPRAAARTGITSADRRHQSVLISGVS